MSTVMLKATTCEAVLREQLRAREKYTVAHDDSHGSGHLVTEAVDRLTHMGEYPTDEAVKHEIVVAIGLLFNAIDVIDRSYEVGTYSVADRPDSYMEFRAGRPE